MHCLKKYLESVGTPDEGYYLLYLKAEVYKEYQQYSFYYDEFAQSGLEAVESVLENQLKGKLGLEDIDWSNSFMDSDCIVLWDLTTPSGTYPSFLRETVELTNKCYK